MNKQRVILTILLAVISAGELCAQDTANMVYNPSFESYVRCPMRIDALGVLRDVEAWWQPTGGSSDYFNVCGSRDCNVPRNKMGFQNARSGKAYCGIYCSQADYREYLQTELKEPLKKGFRYRVSYWVSLAEKSPQAVATLGAVLSAERVTDSTLGVIMRREYLDLDGEGRQNIATFITPQVCRQDTATLDNTKEWVEISGDVTAQGGERFLTLGNFLPTNKSGVKETRALNAVLSGAYYYIDDVRVTCLTPDTLVPPPAPAPPSANSVVRLGEVYFATGESQVQQQSYRELYHLRQMLETHPTMRIEIRGHTDDQGTVEHNQRLSEARAKAIADYLVSQGISRSRITWVGYGETMPVDDNTTPEGRRNNRRVEYRVIAE